MAIDWADRDNDKRDASKYRGNDGYPEDLSVLTFTLTQEAAAVADLYAVSDQTSGLNN